MILNDLIPSLIDCARKAVNDPCSHFKDSCRLWHGSRIVILKIEKFQ